MGFVKDLYIDLVEACTTSLVEGGMDEGAAYDIASERSYRDLGDHMADLADQARQSAKDGR